MRCENNFCIYWKDKSCILDEISLDIQGQCEDCIYIDLDENFSRSFSDMRIRNNQTPFADQMHFMQFHISAENARDTLCIPGLFISS